MQIIDTIIRFVARYWGDSPSGRWVIFFLQRQDFLFTFTTYFFWWCYWCPSGYQDGCGGSSHNNVRDIWRTSSCHKFRFFLWFWTIPDRRSTKIKRNIIPISNIMVPSYIIQYGPNSPNYGLTFICTNPLIQTIQSFEFSLKCENCKSVDGCSTQKTNVICSLLIKLEYSFCVQCRYKFERLHISLVGWIYFIC